MLIADLIAVIEGLPAAQPQADAYEAGPVLGSSRASKAWYRHQKEHRLGWLSEYHGSGAYGRQRGSGDPRLAYNRFQCAPGLIWLAEALGEEPDVVRRAIAVVQTAPPRGASQCGAVRAVSPWARIEELAARQPRRRSRVTAVTARAAPKAGARPVTRSRRVAGRPRRGL